MKNKLTDLNDHLFAQLERLSDEDLTSEKLDVEVKRTSAIIETAKTIIDNARVVVDAHKLFEGGRIGSIPAIVESKVIEQK